MDTAALTDDLADYLAESMRASVATVIDGWRDDDLALLHDWHVRLDADVPVSIWVGDQDRMVPNAHGEWLAEHLPNAQLHRRSGQGRMSLFADELDAIVAGLIAWLTRRAGRMQSPNANGDLAVILDSGHIGWVATVSHPRREFECISRSSSTGSATSTRRAGQ